MNEYFSVNVQWDTLNLANIANAGSTGSLVGLWFVGSISISSALLSLVLPIETSLYLESFQGHLLVPSAARFESFR